MKMGDTKYYRVKQIIKDKKCIGNLILIGRQYGYIVQLHYFAVPGYAINETYETITKAERRFNKILSEDITK